MTEIEPISITIELPIVIRAARVEDLAGLEWYGEFEHYRNLFRRSFREQGQGKRLMLIADCNNVPIGRVFIQFISNNLQVADGAERAYLYSFHVVDIFRGRGIGTLLLDEAETVLRQRQFERVTIAVAKENIGAIRLYERCGYRVYAESPGSWRYLDHKGIVREVYEPTWLLQKNLNKS